MHSVQKGTPITSGTAIGKAFVVSKVIERPEFSTIDNREIGIEIERLDLALARTRSQLEEILFDIDRSNEPEMHQIISAYLTILGDPAARTTLEKTIEEDKLSAEAAVFKSIDEVNLLLENASESQRRSSVSFLDILYHLYLNLAPESEADKLRLLIKAFDEISEPAILIAFKLPPQAIAAIPRHKLLGIILEEEATTSHSAIFAQSLRLPVMVNMPGICTVVHYDEIVLVDCNAGIAIIEPDGKEIEEHGSKAFPVSTGHRWNQMPATRDGTTIRIEANVSNIADAEDAKKQGISHIGLLRSELFYLGFRQMPTIEEEVAIYKRISVLGIRRIDIRLLDIGGDKSLPYFQGEKDEENPEMGLRGIRLLLSNPGLIRKQLSAVNEIAGSIHVRVLLPFVTDIDEVRSVKRILSEMQFPGRVEIGIMAEIPATLLTISEFTPEIDFINVGTNDLIQYLFAADRHNRKLERYSRFDHHLLLRMVRDAIMTAQKHGCEIKFCGEMASDPRGAALLIGAGARVLSLHPDAIDAIGMFISRHGIADMALYYQNVINSRNEEQRKDAWQKLLSVPRS